jgi:hypothetical protein
MRNRHHLISISPEPLALGVVVLILEANRDPVALPHGHLRSETKHPLYCTNQSGKSGWLSWTGHVALEGVSCDMHKSTRTHASIRFRRSHLSCYVLVKMSERLSNHRSPMHPRGRLWYPGGLLVPGSTTGASAGDIRSPSPISASGT